MCRLFFAQNAQPEKIEYYLRKFQLMAENGYVPDGYSRGHHDGWGMIGFKKGSVAALEKSSEDASEDFLYKKASEQILNAECDLVISHLRKSSVGIVSDINTHPFVKKGFSFCHNGTILDYKNIPIEMEYEKLIDGATDSERFFMFLLQHIAKQKDQSNPHSIRKGIEIAVQYINQHIDYMGLNFILTDGTNSWILRDYKENNPIVQEKNLEKYYTLYYGENKQNKSIVISSEIIVDPDVVWTPFNNHELYEIGSVDSAVHIID